MMSNKIEFLLSLMIDKVGGINLNRIELLWLHNVHIGSIGFVV